MNTLHHFSLQFITLHIRCGVFT